MGSTWGWEDCIWVCCFRNSQDTSYLLNCLGYNSLPIVWPRARALYGLVRLSHALPSSLNIISHSHLDGFHPISSERLRTVVDSVAESDDEATPGKLDAFTHYTCPTLPHFIALLCRPTASCIPQGTSLIVVDSLSALVNHAFPKTAEGRGAGDLKGPRGLFLLFSLSTRVISN